MVRSWGIHALFAIACFACGDDDDVAPADAPRTRDAGQQVVVDAGAAPKPPKSPKLATDAGMAAAKQSFASAYATLIAVQDDAADGGVSLKADAYFSETVEGIDFQIKLQGCDGESTVPLTILQASDCSLGSLRGAPWSDGRGKGLPALLCAGTGFGVARTGYQRSAKHKAPWSIGDGKDSDLIGHALVARDPATDQVIACGVIKRAADRERRPLPPADQAPKLASRAAVGAVCHARQFVGASAKCPDNEALVACEAVHCDLAQCLDTCASYTACLDQQSDACSFSCEPSAECVTCQNDMQQCAYFYCGEHVLCGAKPTPDGPCLRLAGCCALQGAEAGGCLGLLLPFLASWGGDANCLGTMMDWDVVSHIPVPCTFGPGEPSSFSAEPQPQSSEPKLADDHAGKPCENDADCPGGNCAQFAADSGGFCTRACEAAAECGRAGMCSGGQSTEGKLCLATCDAQLDCRAGFVCGSRLAGTGISVPGVCSPKRQPDQLADDTAGRACERNEDCSGGQCAKTNLIGGSYPGNYCTARCYEDLHCGKGGVCVWTHQSPDPGYCLQACAADADCTREDYGCWEIGDGTRTLHGCYPRNRALPDGRAGQACSSDADCGAPNAKCAKELAQSGLVTNDLKPAPGGYCTQPCALDIECGAGAQCINYGSSGGHCFASCNKDKACREGYVCFAHSRDNDHSAAVCVTPGL